MEQRKPSMVVRIILFAALLISVAYVGLTISENYQNGSKLQFVSDEEISLEINMGSSGVLYVGSSSIEIPQNMYVKNTGLGALYPFATITIPTYNDQPILTINELGDGWTLLSEENGVYQLEYQALNPDEQSTFVIKTATMNETAPGASVQLSYKSEGHSTKLVSQETARQLFLGTGGA